MTKPKPTQTTSTLVRASVSVVLLALAVWLVGSHWQTVSASLRVAQSAQTGWFVLAALLSLSTYPIAAAIYGMLALHPLRYRQTLVVEISTAFVNRLLPSGIGGLGLHGVYLYKRKHTAAEATVVVSVNNLVGMVAHALLLVLVVLFASDAIGDLFGRHDFHLPGIFVPAIILVVLALSMIPPLQSRLISFVRNLLASIRQLRISPLVRALALAVLLTCTYTIVLTCSARAVGVEIGIVKIFIIFSLGMLAGTAAPTPGGLVGAEAGLFAGFVAYGVSTEMAGAAVVLYRLVTYVLPLLPGVFFLSLARKQKLV